MTACIIGLGTAVVLIGWHGPVRAPPVSGRLPVAGTLAWVAVLVAGCLWELGALLRQPSLTTDSYSQRRAILTCDREVGPVAVPVDHVPHLGQDVRPAEVFTDAHDPHRGRCPEDRVPHGRPVGPRECAPDAFGQDLDGILRGLLRGNPLVDGDQRRVTEEAGQARGIVEVEGCRRGRRLRRGHDGLFLGVVPAANHELRHLLRGADPAVERGQVLAIDQEPRVAGIGIGVRAVLAGSTRGLRR